MNKPSKVSLPERPNLSLIPKAVRQCLDNKINPEEIITEKSIFDLNFVQFCFLIGVKSFRGKNFSKNFSLIKKYISFHKNNIDLTLQTENGLHFCFLKRYETEDAYNKFYNFFSKLYFKKKKNQNNSRKTIDSILFFVHTPTFLAHTNPMFKMLENRKNKNIKVAIACQGFNKQFFEKCRSLDIEFFNVYDESINNSFKKVLKLTIKYKTVIWLSVPIYLSYFRTLYNDVSYWSHKFHPNISGLRSYVSAFNNKSEKRVYYNKNFWENIDVGFEIKNQSIVPMEWSFRKFNFGSFCREELIDSEQYWKSVKLILEVNPQARYFYCGKKEIHLKWCNTLNIDVTKIIYNGWLTHPHEKIREMAFLLDGFTLGHGYLALEAMAAKVPIIIPANRKVRSMIDNIIENSSLSLSKKDRIQYLEKYLLKFETDDELLHLSKKLFSDEKFNKFYADEYYQIIKNFKQSTFENFVEIIQ